MGDKRGPRWINEFNYVRELGLLPSKDRCAGLMVFGQKLIRCCNSMTMGKNHPLMGGLFQRMKGYHTSTRQMIPLLPVPLQLRWSIYKYCNGALKNIHRAINHWLNDTRHSTTLLTNGVTIIFLKMSTLKSEFYRYLVQIDIIFG